MGSKENSGANFQQTFSPMALKNLQAQFQADGGNLDATFGKVGLHPGDARLQSQQPVAATLVPATLHVPVANGDASHMLALPLQPQ